MAANNCTNLHQGGLEQLFRARTNCATKKCMRTRVATDISALFLVMVEFVSYKTADGELWNSIPLLECGATCLYTIPEFSVITVKLRRVKFQCFMPNHTTKVIDGFIRDDPSLDRVYPTEVMVQASSENACIVKVSMPLNLS